MMKYLGLLLISSCVLIVRGGVIEIEVPQEITEGPENGSKNSVEAEPPNNSENNSTLKLVHVVNK